MLSVLCPQCKSAYRVDEARIPPQGGVITCKQCQTRIPLRPPAAAPMELIEELTDADEVADEATVRAPAPALTRSPTPVPGHISEAIPPSAPAPAPAPAAPAMPRQEPEEPQSLDISLPELGQAAALARASVAASASQEVARTGSSLSAPENAPAAHPKGTLSAHQNASAAHEVAPGSNLYECPHCRKPFYLSEAKPVPSDGKAGASHAPPLATGRAAPADGRKTVMVVDDQEFFRTFTRDLLGRRYRVLEARTVAEAVAQLPECQLLVLDLTLENEDGREVLRRKPAGVKCLIFSGQEDSMIDPAVFRELQAMGADDMLFKSIAAGDALKEKVGRMLGEIVDEKPSLD